MKKTGEMVIKNEFGLHARPAAALVSLTSKFNSQIFLIKDETKVNAKSILGVLVLAAENGSTVKVEAEGEDAEDAVQQILELAENHFGTE
ncbi:MAG: HPr family phosphocarrier protein [Candidatus Marinimicrobia bacterium]|nr:HPr family phosphocarrier protein [Candidatus Neomarinimicrobiota bacterium]MCF7830094.1 HPr family phosphocarrier protein [Candidatus Neomarinimicrobiota bacterium]MCF7882141.1 HPr family phosphocarrier protein [Candidatus Neomarinimicrobiota bacterium]